MIKKYPKIVLAALVLVFVLSLPVYGQCQGCPGHQKQEEKASTQMTPEQEKQIMDLKTTLIKEIDPIKTELKVKQLELKTLWAIENPDAGKIKAKVREIAELRIKLQEKMINHKLAVLKILTAEQRKIMKNKMGMHDCGCCGMDCGCCGMHGKCEQGGKEKEEGSGCQGKCH